MTEKEVAEKFIEIYSNSRNSLPQRKEPKEFLSVLVLLLIIEDKPLQLSEIWEVFNEMGSSELLIKKGLKNRSLSDKFYRYISMAVKSGAVEKIKENGKLKVRLKEN